jgi:hypothetical protein
MGAVDAGTSHVGCSVKFFLGTHQPHWLAEPRCEGVPLFVSRRTLARYVTLPRALTDFALDSGGFTELQLHGMWTVSAAVYIAFVLMLVAHFGRRMLWVAPRDWMCEPIVINGGVVRGNRAHIGREWLARSTSGAPWRTSWSYAHSSGILSCRCCRGGPSRKIKGGIRFVGTGLSVEAMDEAERIMRSLAPLRLHGFGFKKAGVERCHDVMKTADSTAWSVSGRKSPPLPGHDRPGPGRPRGHKNCANCLEYALGWREELLDGLRRGQEQARREQAQGCFAFDGAA